MVETDQKNDTHLIELYRTAVDAIDRDSSIRVKHTNRFLIINASLLSALYYLGKKLISVSNPGFWLFPSPPNNDVLFSILFVVVCFFGLMATTTWHGVVRRLRHGMMFRYCFLAALEIELFEKPFQQYLSEMIVRGYSREKVEEMIGSMRDETYGPFNYLDRVVANFEENDPQTSFSKMIAPAAKVGRDFWNTFTFNVDTPPDSNVSKYEGHLASLLFLFYSASFICFIIPPCFSWFN